MGNETATPQAQAAPVASTPAPANTPAPTASEVLDKLTTAKMEGATQEQLDELASKFFPSSAPAQAAAAVEPNKEQEPPAAEIPPAEAPAATPEPETAPEPTAGEIPPATPEPQVQPDSDEDQPGRKGYRPRLDSLPDTQKEAIALVKSLAAQGQNISLGEAEARVNAKYGIIPGVAEAPQPAAPTISAMETELDSVRAQIKAAKEAADGTDTEALEERRIDLLTEIKAAKLFNQVRQQEDQRTAAQVNQQRDQVFAQAAAKYPALNDQSSPQYLVAKALAMQAAQDPSHPDHAAAYTANAPMVFADRAAAKLAIKPATATPPPATPQAPSSVPPAAVPPKPVPVKPAPGSLTSAPPAAQKSREEIIRESEARVLAATEGRGTSNLLQRGTIFVR